MNGIRNEALAVLVLLTSVLVCSCAPGRLRVPLPGGAGGWRMYGGDRSGSCNAPVRLEPPLEQAWEYGTGSGTGPFPPAVAGTTVVVATLSGEVRAVDLVTGLETGSTEFPSAIFGTPVLLEDGMIVAMSGEEHAVVFRRTRDDASGWSATAASAESAPLYDDGRLFLTCLDGTLRCFDAARGTERWKFAAGDRGGPDRIRSSPACDDSVVVFGSDGGNVYAVGKASGDLVWKSAVGSAVFAPAAIADGHIVVVPCTDGSVRGLSIRDGSTVWATDLGSPLYGGAAAGNGMLYAGTAAGNLFALDAEEGRIVWTARTAGGISSAPLLAGDHLFVGDMAGNLHAVESRSGKIVWSRKLSGRVKSTPVAAGEYLLVLTDDRSLVAFRRPG